MMPKPVAFACAAAYFCSFIIDWKIIKSFCKFWVKCPFILDVDIFEKPDFKTKRISWLGVGGNTLKWLRNAFIYQEESLFRRISLKIELMENNF